MIIWICASLGDLAMEMGMEIEAISKSLDDGNNPGINSWSETVLKYIKRALTAARQREERRDRLKRKNRRSILGTVKTT